MGELPMVMDQNNYDLDSDLFNIFFSLLIRVMEVKPAPQRTTPVLETHAKTMASVDPAITDILVFALLVSLAGIVRKILSMNACHRRA